MRIVYLNPVGALGGAERALLNLLASLRQTARQVRPHLLICGHGPLAETARAIGVDATVLPIPVDLAALGDSGLRGTGRFRRFIASSGRAATALPAACRYLRDLCSLIKKIAPDLIHSNGIKAHLLTRLLGEVNAPVLWHLHDFLGARPLAGPLLGWASRGMSGAVAVSAAVARDAQNVLPHCKQIHVLHNAIDIDHFSPAVPESSALDRQSGILRIGLVATFARWKGHDLFLRAAAQLLREHSHPPVRFYIVGSPIYLTAGSQFTAAELKSLAAELGISEHVCFVEFQPDPAGLYRSLDIVVHASTRPEPFGMTIVEAMACGRAVVVSRAGGAEELFTHDHDALAVSPNNATSLASAMRRLIESESLRRRLGTAARATAVSRFNRDRLGPAVLSIYDNLLSGRHVH